MNQMANSVLQMGAGWQSSIDDFRVYLSWEIRDC